MSSALENPETLTKSLSEESWQSVKRYVETAMPFALGVACIDLDSVLLYHNSEDGISRLGHPLPLGQKLTRLLKDRGYRVVVLTSRPPNNDQPEFGLCHGGICTYLKVNGFCVDEVTNVKPPADVYLDDKAYRIPKNWK